MVIYLTATTPKICQLNYYFILHYLQRLIDENSIFIDIIIYVIFILIKYIKFSLLFKNSFLTNKKQKKKKNNNKKSTLKQIYSAKYKQQQQ